VRCVPSVGACAEGADVVIESVVENLEVKGSVLCEALEVARPDALLATNTSQLSITAIAAATGAAADRVVGLHFFNPAVLMRLVEIVRGLRTDEATLERARRFAASLNKEVVVCRKQPRFPDVANLGDHSAGMSADARRGGRQCRGHRQGAATRFQLPDRTIGSGGSKRTRHLLAHARINDSDAANASGPQLGCATWSRRGASAARAAVESTATTPMDAALQPGSESHAQSCGHGGRPSTVDPSSFQFINDHVDN
jgi:hypothetical protein